MIFLMSVKLGLNGTLLLMKLNSWRIFRILLPVNSGYIAGMSVSKQAIIFLF